MKVKKIITAVAIVSSCLLVGFISGMITRAEIPTWYASLEKPFFNPPNWLFGPVWTTLYILMGVAAALVWNYDKADLSIRQKALRIFILQLAFNFLWSYLFFGLHNPLLAFFELIVLWLFIFETFQSFRKILPKAAYLLLPYLAWVGFAGLLNLAIYWLNRS